MCAKSCDLSKNLSQKNEPSATLLLLSLELSATALFSRPVRLLQGPTRYLSTTTTFESQTQVCFIPQYHQCHPKNHFTNNWVYQILTFFGIELIFIGLTLLVLIFLIIKFKFLGQVCFSQFEQKILRETLSQKNNPLNQKILI